MKTAETFWDDAAEKYAKSAIADEASYRYTLERTQSYLSADDKVLEVGCGTGSTALLLAEHVKHITASDVSGNMIQIGQEKAQTQNVSNIKFVVSDLCGNAPDNEVYDAVLAHNVLHLLEDIPAAIQHISKHLKTNGIFISKTVCAEGKGLPFKYRIMKFILPLLQLFGMAPYVHFISAAELETIIKTNGFKILESGDFPSRYIVARKA